MMKHWVVAVIAAVIGVLGPGLTASAQTPGARHRQGFAANCQPKRKSAPARRVCATPGRLPPEDAGA